MAYIGAEPLPGQNREVDDISSSFNGSTTAFTLQVSGVNVSPESANNILVNIGGVIQNPGTDYTIAASTITFTTAPASGLSFFALILGAGINTATVADQTIGTSKVLDNAITADKLAHTSVTAGSYTTADITVDAQGRITAAANGSIATAEIADNAVTTSKIADEAVTLAKLPHGTGSNDGKFLRANNGADPTFETVTSTTINSNAVDRVITGSDTANTLTGRSDFTFNGATTTITNGSGLNKFILKGDVSGGALGASLQLRNTNSANNGLTDIQFLDSGSNTYAKIQGTNLTDASNNGFLSFFTSSATAGLTERAKLTDGGNFEISDGDLVIGTDGHGIDFSAQTAASNAYTKDSELLDHYEEGTFTPNISSPQLNSCQLAAFTDASFTQRNGNYIKIGRLVMFVVEIQMASSTTFANGDGSQVNAIMNAFPFARATSSRPISSPCGIRFSGSTYTDHRIYADARNDFSPPFVRVTESEGSGLGTLTISEAFPASAHVQISGFYLADA